MKKINYRNIYEKHYGPIPDGYHIHHRDGNHLNNKIENLQCVSPQEHYEIHKSQKDFVACKLLSEQFNLELTPEELHYIRSESSKSISNRLLQNKEHNFQTNHPVHKMIKERKHHFQCKEFQSIQGKKSVKISFSKGTHNLLSNNPNLKIVTCPHCNKSGSKPGLIRWHFDNCKEKDKNDRKT